ncbi:MAG TPA: DUF5076 domain-containing protein [Lysobacter sp.]
MERRELDMPAAAVHDPAAFELLRLWVADRRLQVSLSPELGANPADFGELLADLFSHACREYASRSPLGEPEIRARMFLAFAGRMRPDGAGEAPSRGQGRLL